MHEVAPDLLILLAGIWLVAATLRPLGLPTSMGETASLQPGITPAKTLPGPLVGKHPHQPRIPERADCSVVAVEDALFVCGTAQAVNRYDEEYPASRR